MPDTIHDLTLEGPELDELRALGPVSVARVVPDWDDRRDALFEQIVGGASAAPTPITTRRRTPRLVAVAAAVALVAGGLGFGALALQRHDAVAPAQSPTSAPVAFPLVSTPPAGRYLVMADEQSTRTDTGLGDHRVSGTYHSSTYSRTFVTDSTGRTTRLVDGNRVDLGPADPLTADVAGAPRTPAALRTWLAGQQSSGNDRGEADVVFTQATDRLRNPLTTPQYRQLLVAALRTNPDTTTRNVTLADRHAVEVSFTNHYAAEGQVPATMEVRSMTLEASSMALLAEHRTLTTDAGTVLNEERRTVVTPAHLTSTRP